MRLGVLSLLLLGASLAFAEDPEERPVPSRLKEPPFSKLKPIAVDADLLLKTHQGPDGRLRVGVAPMDQALTIDAKLQQQLTEILEKYETPYAAVVAIEPSTGRVLAMAEHAEGQPDLRGLCVKAVYPAASVFKIVTASALLKTAISLEDVTCFHGGKRKLTPELLADDDRDNRCATLADAFGVSANVVFAKQTARFLDSQQLTAAAKALFFNSPIPFPIPVEVSLASIPEDSFELAVAGAGFGDVYLSPLHGAMLAATVANRGEWRAPKLFENATSVPAVRVMTTEVADQLTDMMEHTITMGTGRRIFRERGMHVEGAVGKTGSLADKTPFHDYSWFVGFAPRDAPRIAVAAVIVNDPSWRIRGTWLGREALRLGMQRLKVPAAQSAMPSDAGSASDAGP